MEKRHRVFIAINLPAEVKKALAKYQEKWPELPAKWTAKDNLHITLVFLGDLTDQEVADVCKITKEIAARQASFSVNLNNVLYGPDKKIPPRFVWATGERSWELSELKTNLEKALLESVRFKPEGRGFSPHITLARISEWQWRAIEPEERPEINEPVDFLFTVEYIDVMESELKRGGPEYVVLESCPLK